ncbi:hypothetical protein EIP91_008044 [Steccherinum ochraceum]|uniref:F-box domain-containing protein n=1 Tax=Steccherinum ochraceum TaxID=92696 RepID=A0A4R0R633_9APHY|nr:hypothetical protein EIP91_008044 [Steccherinum ochraceum]
MDSLTTRPLPVELLLLIFRFACTDGGPTGCILNLTCKAFRALCVDTSVDVRISYVAGIRQADKFLEMLLARGPRGRRVESLFLALGKRHFWYERRRKRGGNEQSAETIAHDRKTLLNAVLLSISPTHLRTLSIQAFSDVTTSTPILPISFPNLTSLTIDGVMRDTVSSIAWSASHPQSALTNLEIRNKTSLPATFFSSTLPDLFPNVVRVAIPAPNVDIKALLRAFCGLPGTDDNAQAITVPRRLSHVEVTLCPMYVYPELGGCKLPEMRYRRATQDLWELAQRGCGPLGEGESADVGFMVGEMKRRLVVSPLVDGGVRHEKWRKRDVLQDDARAWREWLERSLRSV